ncbi:MAG: hypothetical protein KAQ94_02790 [Arcobacteraceae bacterium]|nr:hypothetical protein [Arcobacteraceae bacterium]
MITKTAKAFAEKTKKQGVRKNASMFQPHEDDILYLHNEGLTYDSILDYLESKGLTRPKSNNSLVNFIKVRKNKTIKVSESKINTSSGKISLNHNLTKKDELQNQKSKPKSKAKRYIAENQKRVIPD